MFSRRVGQDESTVRWLEKEAQDRANAEGVAYVVFSAKECSVNSTSNASPYIVREDNLTKWERDPKNQVMVVRPQQRG